MTKVDGPMEWGMRWDESMNDGRGGWRYNVPIAQVYRDINRWHDERARAQQEKRQR